MATFYQSVSGSLTPHLSIFGQTFGQTCHKGVTNFRLHLLDEIRLGSSTSVTLIEVFIMSKAANSYSCFNIAASYPPQDIEDGRNTLKSMYMQRQTTKQLIAWNTEQQRIRTLKVKFHSGPTTVFLNNKSTTGFSSFNFRMQSSDVKVMLSCWYNAVQTFQIYLQLQQLWINKSRHDVHENAIPNSAKVY